MVHLDCSLVYPLRFCLFSLYGDHRDLHSFPTRRSSDLNAGTWDFQTDGGVVQHSGAMGLFANSGTLKKSGGTGLSWVQDRKSTRLNSSHRCISYAVFCLKKQMPSR